MAVKWLTIAVTGLAMALLAGAYVLPGEVVVQRSAVIEAPPAAVYAVLDDLGRFSDWSPWARLDRDVSYAVTGPAEGVDQTVAWQSRDWRIGSGTMTIVASVPARQVMIALDLGRLGKATSVFDLAPAGSGTAVTWGFKAELGGNPLRRLMGPLYGWWVGSEYLQGLANLKQLLENGTTANGSQ